MVSISTPDYFKDVCLLLVRIVVGFAFLVSARNKGRNIKKFAKTNGLPVPMAVVVMCTEFVAALAMLSGVAAQFGAIAIMLLMLGTIRLHIFKWKSPYWAASGGWEYDLMLLAFAFCVLVFGPGSLVLFK